MLTPCVSRRSLSAPDPRQRKARTIISAEKSAPAPATKTAILPRGRNISRRVRPTVLLMEPPIKSPLPRVGGGALKPYLGSPKAAPSRAAFGIYCGGAISRVLSILFDDHLSGSGEMTWMMKYLALVRS